MLARTDAVVRAMRFTVHHSPVTDARHNSSDEPDTEQFAGRAEIIRATIGLSVYALMFGTTFGAVAVSSGLSVAQAMVLSLVLFSGASQFAFVGVAATGSPFAAIPAALLLGVRNSFYGLTISQILRPRGIKRLLSAQFFIDETTALTVAQRSPQAKRFAFWASAGAMFTLWNIGTLLGAVLGSAVDTEAFGLDAAAPIVFIALIWPALRSVSARVVAGVGAGLALLLIPLSPPGVPVMAAVGVAVVAGIWVTYHRPAAAEGSEG